MDAKRIRVADKDGKTVDLENNEIEAIRRENVQLREENNKLKGLETLVDKLKDKVECPVCFEIPRSGPIPVCPNGHFVCKTCKKDICPTCRTNMNQGRSLMADILIEHIDHKCKFVDCDQYLKLGDYEEHTRVCSHRTVSCPAVGCKEEVSLSSLMGNHGGGDCEKIFQQNFGDITASLFFTSDHRNTEAGAFSWKTRHMVIFNKHFFLKIGKSSGTFYSVMVLAGSKEECKEFVVDLTIHKKSESIESSILKIQFSDYPCSIDVEKQKQKDLGLVVVEKVME